MVNITTLVFIYKAGNYLMDIYTKEGFSEQVAVEIFFFFFQKEVVGMSRNISPGRS